MGRGRGPLDASYRLSDDEADNGRGRSEASLDLRSGVLFEGIPSRLQSPIKKKMTKNLFLVTLLYRLQATVGGRYFAKPISITHTSRH